MKRVTGIGGIFIKARDPKALGEWYREHLGIDVQDWGGTAFRWNEPEAQPEGLTVWSLFPESTTYFDPSPAPFMINYRVENLAALLDALRAEGCRVDDKIEVSEFGRFGWVMDPDGNRVVAVGAAARTVSRLAGKIDCHTRFCLVVVKILAHPRDRAANPRRDSTHARPGQETHSRRGRRSNGPRAAHRTAR